MLAVDALAYADRHQPQLILSRIQYLIAEIEQTADLAAAHLIGNHPAANAVGEDHVHLADVRDTRPSAEGRHFGAHYQCLPLAYEDIPGTVILGHDRDIRAFGEFTQQQLPPVHQIVWIIAACGADCLDDALIQASQRLGNIIDLTGGRLHLLINLKTHIGKLTVQIMEAVHQRS